MPKKLSTNTKILICLATAFVILSSILLANLLTMAVYPTSQSSQEIKSGGFELHFLTVGKSQNKLSAEAISEDYQKLGSGGFVWQKDEYFYVVSSIYQNKNDANLVQTNLKNSGIESEIFTLAFKPYSITGTFDNEEKKVLTKALNIAFSSYQNLYDTAISLDTAVYNQTSAKLAVNAVHSSINSALADFQTIFLNFENEKLLTMLKNIQKASTSLCSDTKISKNQTYSSLIKYYYTSIIFQYFQLTNIG